MSAASKLEPYGSAADLPSFREIQELLLGFKVITAIFARDQRQKLRDLEVEMKRMIRVVDGFYDILGDRNWIFVDTLKFDEIDRMLDESSTPEQAEERVIEIYQRESAKQFFLIQVQNQEGLRQRRHLIDRALEHYHDMQYDSCTMLLVAVIDGFVNDFEPGERKGVASRDPNSMVAWDSVAGHHKGLSHVLKTFTKTIKKRVDEEIFEVHRHGIMHGSTPHFDNVVVATKAWNLLFAVVDWAKATEKSQKPVEPKPTLSDVWSTLKDHTARKRYRENFEAYSVQPDDPEFADLSAVVTATKFLESWHHKRWGLVAESLGKQILGKRSKGEQAKFAKSIYDREPLVTFELESVEFEQASVAVLHLTATVGERSGKMSMRWIYYDAENNLALNDDPDGKWTLGVYPPRTFWKEDENASDDGEASLKSDAKQH